MCSPHTLSQSQSNAQGICPFEPRFSAKLRSWVEHTSVAMAAALQDTFDALSFADDASADHCHFAKEHPKHEVSRWIDRVSPTPELGQSLSRPMSAKYERLCCISICASLIRFLYEMSLCLSTHTSCNTEASGHPLC